MKRYEVQEKTYREEVLVEVKCDECGALEQDTRWGRLIPVTIHIDPGEEGGATDELDYCDDCLVAKADALVAAGSTSELVASGRRPAPQLGVCAWDWKDQPDWDELSSMAARLTDGRLYLREVSTGETAFAVVLSTTPLSEEEATEEYRNWLASEEDQANQS